MSLWREAQDQFLQTLPDQCEHKQTIVSFLQKKLHPGKEAKLRVPANRCNVHACALRKEVFIVVDGADCLPDAEQDAFISDIKALVVREGPRIRFAVLSTYGKDLPAVGQ